MALFGKTKAFQTSGKMLMLDTIEVTQAEEHGNIKKDYQKAGK